MLILFWVIMALTAALVSRSARYAVRQYVADRNRVILTLYIFFLLLLGYMLIHITTRVITLVQSAAESDQGIASPLPRHHAALAATAPASILGD